MSQSVFHHVSYSSTKIINNYNIKNNNKIIKHKMTQLV